MRLTTIPIQTLREDPSDAEVPVLISLVHVSLYFRRRYFTLPTPA